MQLHQETPVNIAPPNEQRAPSTIAAPTAARAHGSAVQSLKQYVAIARPDHWFKNVFMALGVVLAYFCHPDVFGLGLLWPIIWAVMATCLIASSNYVLNEILDAPTDCSHPIKRHRPIPSGQVRLGIAYAEWVLLGILGLAM